MVVAGSPVLGIAVVSDVVTVVDPAMIVAVAAIVEVCPAAVIAVVGLFDISVWPCQTHCRHCHHYHHNVFNASSAAIILL